MHRVQFTVLLNSGRNPEKNRNPGTKMVVSIGTNPTFKVKLSIGVILTLKVGLVPMETTKMHCFIILQAK